VNFIRSAWLRGVNDYKYSKLQLCPLVLTRNYAIDIDFSPEAEILAVDWLKVEDGYLVARRPFAQDEAIIFLTEEIKNILKCIIKKKEGICNARYDGLSLHATETIAENNDIVPCEKFWEDIL
jgi:hypothetical protein